MAAFDDPFDPSVNLEACACGRHASQADHDAQSGAMHTGAVDAATREAPQTWFNGNEATEAASNRMIEQAVVRALFPRDELRRNFLKAVGVRTAMSAIASVLPVGAMQAIAQDTKLAIEKKDLQIGFVPITCATPLIMSAPLKFYEREGLNVSLQRTAGWALVRDKMINKEYDASHMLSPMPLSISLGLGSVAAGLNVATVQNINGQAITLHQKFKDRRDPKAWKGMRFAIPFEYSIHNLLLRYYVAEAGLDPDKDIQIRVTPPAEMVANLRAGNIDGFLGPEPFNQRAVYDGVGFIHLLTKELWDGHPCCAFGVSDDFIKQNPNTFSALYRAILNAHAMARDPKHRSLIANAIAPTQYLNQPFEVLEQVLSGTFADGLGNIRKEPNRVDFDPFPSGTMAVWILSQLKRWGYVKGDVSYRKVAEEVFMMTDARKVMTGLGMTPPKEAYPKIKVMGKEFDPAKNVDQYVGSFAIRRT